MFIVAWGWLGRGVRRGVSFARDFLCCESRVSLNMVDVLCSGDVFYDVRVFEATTTKAIQRVPREPLTEPLGGFDRR